MTTAKWATPSAQGTDIAGATLTSLANGSTSAFVTHDNSSNLDLYASVLVNLNSITPSTGGSITLRVFALQGADLPDNTGSVGGGDAYTQPLTTTASSKSVVFPLVRLYPESCRMCITNNSGVPFASTGTNSIKVRPYNEAGA